MSPEFQNPRGFEYANKDLYGEYNQDTDTLSVCNKACTSDSTSRDFRNYCWQTKIHTGRNGKRETEPVPGDSTPIPVTGNGEANAIGIIPGPNSQGQLDSTPVPDDVRVSDPQYGWVIKTGPNGLLNTVKSGRDEYMKYEYEGVEYSIVPGWGKPFSIGIHAGSDNWMRSIANKYGDDDLDSRYVQVIRDYDINYSGIDLCSITCIHERQHQSNYKDTGTNTDGDGVVDSKEGIAPYYLDPEYDDTYDMVGEFGPDYIGFGDDEFLCRMAETAGPGTTHPEWDWSDANGKQWHQ